MNIRKKTYSSCLFITKLTNPAEDSLASLSLPGTPRSSNSCLQLFASSWSATPQCWLTATLGCLLQTPQIKTTKTENAQPLLWIASCSVKSITCSCCKRISFACLHSRKGKDEKHKMNQRFTGTAHLTLRAEFRVYFPHALFKHLQVRISTTLLQSFD